MGVGKSTIGRRLADRFDLQFKDSDHEIEIRTGASIPLIFDIEGEAGFRRREHTVIDELTKISGIVLATGGGVILDEANRLALKQHGLVIYLHAPVEALLERTAFCRNRPLLQTEDPKTRLEEIIFQRQSLYQATADIIIDTNNRSIVQVTRYITKKIKRLRKNS